MKLAAGRAETTFPLCVHFMNLLQSTCKKQRMSIRQNIKGNGVPCIDNSGLTSYRFGHWPHSIIRRFVLYLPASEWRQHRTKFGEGPGSRAAQREYNLWSRDTYAYCLLSLSMDLKQKVQQSPWEADSHSANQNFPGFYGNRRFITVFTDDRQVPILSQINPVHAFPPYFPKINSNIIFPSMPRSSEWSLPFRFSYQNVFLVSPMLYVPPISCRQVMETVIICEYSCTSYVSLLRTRNVTVKQ
jgi:hypothetical protein